MSLAARQHWEAAHPQSASDDALGRFILSLRTRGIRDQRLLAAIEAYPRARFVPAAYAGLVFEDISLPLPCGQETGSPFALIDAVLALDIRPDDQILEVGAGSGWQTALMARLGGAVASMERWGALAHDATLRLRESGLRNALVVHADGAEGLAAGAPYDRIIVNAALDAIPETLMSQLALDGVLIAPMRIETGQYLMRIRKSRSAPVMERLGDVRYAPLVSGVSHPI